LIEEIDLGETVEVNNRTINGPACIVREWQLRSIAVCKSGADPNTITALKANGEIECKYIKGKNTMDETKVEVVDNPTAVETDLNNVEVVELASPTVETNPAKQDEGVVDSGTPTVEAETSVVVHVEVTTEAAVEPDDEDEEDEMETVVEAPSIEPAVLVAPEVIELSQQVTDFQSQIQSLKNENEELKNRLTALSNCGEKTPVSFSVAPDTDKNTYNVEKRNQLIKMGIDPAKAQMAAGIKLPK
jgi:hypothetical protein